MAGFRAVAVISPEKTTPIPIPAPATFGTAYTSQTDYITKQGVQSVYSTYSL